MKAPHQVACQVLLLYALPQPTSLLHRKHLPMHMMGCPQQFARAPAQVSAEASQTQGNQLHSDSAVALLYVLWHDSGLLMHRP